jgi:hypothetical protein
VEKNVKSAFDSTTFNADIKFHVQKELNDIGSATISPSGRDVAIASYVSQSPMPDTAHTDKPLYVERAAWRSLILILLSILHDTSVMASHGLSLTYNGHRLLFESTGLRVRRTKRR